MENKWAFLHPEILAAIFLILIILAVPLESYMPSFRSNFVPAVSVQSDWRTSRSSLWQVLAGEISSYKQVWVWGFFGRGKESGC